MNERTKSEFLKYAIEKTPFEACGVILNIDGKEKFNACKNLSTDKNNFILDPIDFAFASDLGQITAVIHSHVNQSPKPSQADLVSCESSGLPWHIVSVPSGNHETIVPTGYVAPLLGRSWVHGVLDCYSLIRDWYKQNRSIDLPDYDRPELWWDKGFDLYSENFKNAGFYEVDSLEPGDGILMQVRSKVINHAGVYVGNNQFMHHAIGRLSCREIYGGYWQKITRKVVRFKS